MAPAGPDAVPPPDVRPRVESPTALIDFLPAALAGAQPTDRGQPDRGAAAIATYDHEGRTVRVRLARIDDVMQTRASLELLGQSAVMRKDGTETRGLRVQGNPAQLVWTLDPPHRATLNVKG